MKTLAEIQSRLRWLIDEDKVNLSKLAEQAKEERVSLNDQPKLSKLAEGNRGLSYEEGRWLIRQLWPDEQALNAEEALLAAARTQGREETLLLVRHILRIEGWKEAHLDLLAEILPSIDEVRQSALQAGRDPDTAMIAATQLLWKPASDGAQRQ